MNYDLSLTYQFLRQHPVEGIRILEKQPIQDVASFLLHAPASLAAEVMRLMNSTLAVQCLELMSARSAAAIVARLPLETASILFRQMNSSRQDSIMAKLPKETVDSIGMLLNYPAETAGALMDPVVFTLPDDIDIKAALIRIRKYPHNIIDYLYIVSRDKHLTGVSKFRELMLASSSALVASVMHGNPQRLTADLDRVAILKHPGWLEFHTLPVVNKDGLFLGVIRYRTLRRLERGVDDSLDSNPLRSTGNALGELYSLGLSGFISGAAAGISRRK